MPVKFKGFKRIFLEQGRPTMQQIGLMVTLLIFTVSLVAFFSRKNYLALEIDGEVVQYEIKSDFHAMPELTIKNDEGRTWVLHNSVFKEVDVRVGHRFIKRSGSTLASINGQEVNIGWR